MSFLQYIKDTRGELRHVAWPTQTQTIIYTVLVIAISLFVSVYLGLFDYLFTSGVETALDFVPTKVSEQQLDTSLSPASLPGPEITITSPENLAPENVPALQIIPQSN